MAHTDEFRLPGSLEGLLPSDTDALIKSLDEQLARAETKQMERTLEDLNRRGFFRSGQTLKQVSEDVLGPGIERRTAALLPLVREERLGELGFQRQRQFAQEDFMRRLDEMREQARLNRELLELQDILTGRQQQRGRRGLGRMFGESLTSGFGSGFGGSIGGRLGGLIGGGTSTAINDLFFP